MREWYQRYLKPLLPRWWIQWCVRLIETITPFRVQQGKRVQQTFRLPRVLLPFLWMQSWILSVLGKTPSMARPRIAFVLDPVSGTRDDVLRTIHSIRRLRGSWVLILPSSFTSPIPHDKRIIRVENIQQPSTLAACFSEHDIDVVCFISSGIMLLLHALQQVAHAVSQHPETTILYGDYAVRSGRVVGHVIHLPKYLKYFFASAPYLPSWSFIRRSCWERAVDTSMRSTNRESLLTQCVHHVDPTTILHLPSILAIANDPIRTQMQPVHYPHNTQARVSMIILTNHFSGLLQAALYSIKKTTQQPHEILIVNNTFDARGNFQPIPRNDASYTVLDYPRPFNFSAMNNLAARHASGEYVLFLNDDTEAIQPGWLEAMVDLALLPDIGIVGATLLYPDSTIQHAGIYLAHPRFGTSYYLHKHLLGIRMDGSREPGFLNILSSVHEVDAVTGACLLISKKIFNHLNGFNERLAVGYNDVDLCLRAQESGYACVVTPNATLRHHESVSRNASNQPAVYRHPEDSAYFIQKWKERLEHNPSLLPASFRHL